MIIHLYKYDGSHRLMFRSFVAYFADTIDKWDESKLMEVVEKKHGGKTKQKTDIVSIRI